MILVHPPKLSYNKGSICAAPATSLHLFTILSFCLVFFVKEKSLSLLERTEVTKVIIVLNTISAVI
jgi:hypothetical protein